MGIFDSIGNTWQLIKNSMALTVKNRAIFSPTLRQVLIGLVVYVLVILSLVIVFFTSGLIQFLAVLMIFGGILFFLLVFPFIKFYYRAAQSWIVYKTFAGEQPPLSAGLKRARQNLGDILGLTIADVILTNLAWRLKSGARQGGLILGLIMFVLGKFVEEAWDLIGNYLLPAAIVPEQNLIDSLKEIPKLKENVPATLVGVFGIDFAGNAVKWYLSLLFFLSLVVGVIFFLIFNSWIVAILVIILYVGFSFIVSIFVDMAKTIYFTTFYVTLTRKNEIAVEYMGEIEAYLKHQPAHGTASQQTGKQVLQETKAEKVARLKPYVERYRKRRYSDEKIKEFLLKNNWPEDVINEAMK